MRKPVASLVGGLLSAVAASGVAAVFRTLAEAGHYVPGPVYFILVPWVLGLVGAISLRLDPDTSRLFRSRGDNDSAAGGCLAVAAPFALVLEICNAFRLGPGNGEPYAGGFFWFSAISLYGLLGAGLGLGVFDAVRARTLHKADEQRIAPMDSRQTSTEVEISWRQLASAGNSDAEPSDSGVQTAIDDLIRTDPANLEAAEWLLGSRLQALDVGQLEERSLKLGDELQTAQTNEATLGERIRHVETRLSDLAANLSAAESELAALTRTDPANARLVVGKLRDAWGSLTIDELASKATTGMIAPRYKVVRMLELEIENTSEAAKQLRSEFSSAVTASLVKKLEAELCRREQLARAGESAADPEGLPDDLQLLEGEWDRPDSTWSA